MPFNVKRRGKVTYYYEGDRPVLSALVSEEQPDEDLKIYFSGLTGAHSAKNVLGLDELATMDPLRELPLVFRCWEKWLRDAGIGESLEDVDFLEMHAFACQPKAPNPLVDPAGYTAELERLRAACQNASPAGRRECSARRRAARWEGNAGRTEAQQARVPPLGLLQAVVACARDGNANSCTKRCKAAVSPATVARPLPRASSGDSS